MDAIQERTVCVTNSSDVSPSDGQPGIVLGAWLPPRLNITMEIAMQ